MMAHLFDADTICPITISEFTQLATWCMSDPFYDKLAYFLRI